MVPRSWNRQFSGVINTNGRTLAQVNEFGFRDSSNSIHMGQTAHPLRPVTSLKYATRLDDESLL